MPCDVFLVATMTTTVLLSPVAAAGVTVRELLPVVAPRFGAVALPEVTRLMAAVAGAADASTSSRMRPSRPTSPNLSAIAGGSFLMPVLGAKAMPDVSFQERNYSRYLSRIGSRGFAQAGGKMTSPSSGSTSSKQSRVANPKIR